MPPAVIDTSAPSTQASRSDINQKIEEITHVNPKSLRQQFQPKDKENKINISTTKNFCQHQIVACLQPSSTHQQHQRKPRAATSTKR
jgi:hypothetical protein